MFGLTAGNIQPFGQTESRYAVDNAEIGGFCFTSHLFAYLIDVYLVYFCGCGGVYILSRDKGLGHGRVAAEVGHDAQFDLRVVGREKQLPLFGNKSSAYFPTFVIAYGDILQVGVTRTESSRCSNGLVERGVYFPGRGVDEFGQGIDIGAEQFAQASVFEYLVDYGVSVAQLFENFFGCRILSGFCFAGFFIYFQPFEENFADLSRRTDIERYTCQCIYLLFCTGKFLGKNGRRSA